MSFPRPAKPDATASLEAPAEWFIPRLQIPKEFKKFFRGEVLSFLDLKGYKLKEKQEVCCQICFSLVVSGLLKRRVACARRGDPFRGRLWDLFVDAGLCAKYKGTPLGHVVSQYYATPRLLTLGGLWERKDLEGAMKTDGLGLVVVKDRETHRRLSIAEYDQENPIENFPLPFEALCGLPAHVQKTCFEAVDRAGIREPALFMRTFFDRPEYWALVSKDLDQINRVNLSHAWFAERMEQGGNGQPQRIAFQPAVAVRQVFAGEPFEYGRYHTWGRVDGQSLSKEERKTIRIDGEETCELDFKGYHIGLMYHRFARTEPPYPDPYAPELVLPTSYPNASEPVRKQLRSLVKAFTIGLGLNGVRGRGQANYAGRGLVQEAGRDVKRAIRLEVGGVSGIIARIEKVHAPIAQYLFQDLGGALMNVDSLIMRILLLGLVVKKGIPALCMHDGLVVKSVDSGAALAMMDRAYSHMTGFRPSIKVD